MQALVLGAAAGGGFPQWNCGCRNCTLARAGSPNALPRSQASIALRGRGGQWMIVGASPDLRAQILANPELAPPAGTRNSPIAAVVLVSADVDGIAGLLTLREQHAFRLLAPANILRLLEQNGVFASLDPGLVERYELTPGIATETALGLRVTLLEMPGKTPLYQETRAALEPEPATTYAARIESGGQVCIVAPACAEITPAVLAALADADLLFFDGTLFTETEMIDAGLSWKTSRRMGHVPVSGPDGSLAGLAGLKARKIYFHINNSNPMLLEDSPERATVHANGFEVSHDGMKITLA